MSRLPSPGGDNGNWGSILNDFLLQAHQADGTLQPITQADVSGLEASLSSKTTTTDLSAVALSGEYPELLNLPNLSTVAVSGSYADLSNKPTIPVVASDINAAPLNSVPQVYQDYIGVQLAGAPFEIPYQIDDAFDFTNTTYQNKYLPVIFDPSRFSPSAEIFFRVDLSQTAAGTGIVYIRLYNMTTGITVAGTTLNTAIGQYGHSIQTSGSIRANLSSGPALYSVEVQAQAGYTGQAYKPSITVRQSGSGNSQPAAQTVAYASNLSVDVSMGETVKVGTLTGNMTVNAPTNAALGKAVTFIFYQDSTGGRVVTWNTAFRSPPPVDTATSSVSVVSFVYDGTQWV